MVINSISERHFKGYFYALLKTDVQDGFANDSWVPAPAVVTDSTVSLVLVDGCWLFLCALSNRKCLYLEQPGSPSIGPIPVVFKVPLQTPRLGEERLARGQKRLQDIPVNKMMFY